MTWKRKVHKNINKKRLAADIKSEVLKLGGKIKENKRVQQILNATKKKIKEEPFLRLTDKICFTVAVMVICFTEYLITLHPQFVPFLYTIVLIPLLTLRVVFYTQKKYEGYMQAPNLFFLF